MVSWNAGRQTAPFVDIAIRGKRELKLSVTNDGKGGRSVALANWGEAILPSKI